MAGIITSGIKKGGSMIDILISLAIAIPITIVIVLFIEFIT